MKQELVSIIMPTYNCGKFIEETIQSVLAQTYKNWELLIVDDCSTDNTKCIVNKYIAEDNRIKYEILKTNSGAAIARNTAIKKAKGKYIAFLDSDDLWNNDKLEKQIRFMKENNYYFTYTNYKTINEASESLEKIVTGPKKITKMGMYNYCWPGCLTVMYDRKKIGLIQIENLKKNNDYAMWLKVIKKSNCYLLDEVLASYRIRTGSISNQSKIKLIKHHYILYKEGEKQNKLIASINTIRNLFFGVLKKLIYVRNITPKSKNKKAYKVIVCGHFGFGKELKNGQTIKAFNIYKELCKIYGEKNIATLDTNGWNKRPFGFFIDCFKSIKSTQNLIILPAQNGLRVFLPLFILLKKIYKTNVIYAVVGGWLPEFIKNKRILKNCLKKVDMILVETSSMAKLLKDIGVEKVDVLLNFKDIQILEEVDLNSSKKDVLRVCTFSRIIKEKGIENSINAVTIANDHYQTQYKLDIYGPIADEYKEEFNSALNNSNKDYVSYKGSVSSEQSVEVIKKYELLLFPTYYEGEGLAGTIIDSFSAGVPVVASDWKYNCDVVHHKVNGFIFETKNDIELAKILHDVYYQKYDMINIKRNCLIEAHKYKPEIAIKGLLKYIIDK